MQKLKILVACEESQIVTMELRKLGHEAYSCDIIECSGGHEEWHVMQDVLPFLNGNCEFNTTDGSLHKIYEKWDMIIAFPPCTHLAVSGAAHFKKKREDGRQRDGIDFFGLIKNADCDRIAIENPVGIIGGDYIKKWFSDLQEKYDFVKCTQKIQPYEFGSNAKKATCLWLKGLPNLIPTDIVDPGEFYVSPKGKKFSVGSSSDMARDENGKIIAWNDPRTAKIRSKTYPGIAKAMSEQWAGGLK
jgi:hypothetical protein